MDVHYLQRGIMEWFQLQLAVENKAHAVQTVCANLYKQMGEEVASKSKYQIISPLLKWGVLEYYKNDYRLSPSCALQKGSAILFCNLPCTGLAQPPIYDSRLGVRVYKDTGQIKTLLQQQGINSMPFKLTGLLQKISLAKAIETWPPVKVSETTGYQILDESNTWQRAKNIVPGVYKTGKEEYARRLIMTSENNWRSISNNWNDYQVAILWSKIQSNFPLFIRYRQKEGLLSLNNEHFPIVLERLLLINTLLEGKFSVDFNRREYYLNANEFATLNKIFHHRISMI
jgi:hypothetical protein